MTEEAGAPGAIPHETARQAQSVKEPYTVRDQTGASAGQFPLAEGVPTASIAARLAREKGIPAPIITAVDQLLDGAITISEAVSNLMSRPLRAEDE